MHSNYSNIFSSGLRVMAQQRQRMSSRLSNTPEAGPSTSKPGHKMSKSVQAWHTALSSARFLKRRDSAAKSGPPRATREVKAARRRTMPSVIVPVDISVSENWLPEKAPLSADVTPKPPVWRSPADEDHHLLDSDDADSCILKPSTIDRSSTSMSFLITFSTPEHSIPPSPHEESFLNFATSELARSSRRRSRALSVPTLPSPIRIPAHPYSMAEAEEEPEFVEDAADSDVEDTSADWRQFHMEWIANEQ